jgi:hypothetical protein
MASDAQRKACKKYYWKTKDAKKAFLIRLDKEQDADVIEALEKAGSKTDFIRDLVRGAGK